MNIGPYYETYSPYEAPYPLPSFDYGLSYPNPCVSPTCIYNSYLSPQLLTAPLKPFTPLRNEALTPMMPFQAASKLPDQSIFKNYFVGDMSPRKEQRKKAKNPFETSALIPLPEELGLGTLYGNANEANFIRRRNERERERVRTVNDGYARLRNSVPFLTARARGRTSKVETLRGAITYISELQKLLDGTGPSSTAASSNKVRQESKRTKTNENQRKSGLKRDALKRSHSSMAKSERRH